MEREKLLTIGSLSKLTGIHIKSLRYYDRIGVLKPAYTDPVTGYRYYTLLQIHMVAAIQLCVELGIPLKDFSKYVAEGNEKIHYTKLLAQGTRLLEEKIASIQERLDFVRRMQSDIRRAEEHAHRGGELVCSMPEKCCWVVPYQGARSDREYPGVRRALLEEIYQAGVTAVYEVGLLRLWRGEEYRQFLFADVVLRSDQDRPHMLRLPAGDYCCRSAGEESLETAPRAFPGLFALDYEKVVIESQLVTGDYEFNNPLIELRCSMPPVT